MRYSLTSFFFNSCFRKELTTHGKHRVSSMVYGRPVSIPHMRHTANSSDFPSQADDSFTALGQAQPDDQPAINAFFYSVTKLYHLMDEILENLQDTLQVGRTSGTRTPYPQSMSPHRQSSEPSALSQLTAIFRLDTLLCQWHNELPPHLKFSLDGLDNLKALSPLFQRQKGILKMRFLGMRILLHRQSMLYLLQTEGIRTWPRNASRKWPPLFSDIHGGKYDSNHHNATIGHKEGSFVEGQLARLSASICVQMAQLQIGTVDAGRRGRLSGAWWWDLHCQFTHFQTSKSNPILFLTLTLTSASHLQLPMCAFRRSWSLKT